MIEIKLLKTTKEQNADIACFLAGIISVGCINDAFSYQKDNGTWVLDTGNNWFAHFYPEDEFTTLRITYRYENDNNRDAIAGLGVWIEYKLATYLPSGLEHLSEEVTAAVQGMAEEVPLSKRMESHGDEPLDIELKIRSPFTNKPPIRHIATRWEITAANAGELRSLLIKLDPQPEAGADGLGHNIVEYAWKTRNGYIAWGVRNDFPTEGYERLPFQAGDRIFLAEMWFEWEQWEEFDRFSLQDDNMSCPPFWAHPMLMPPEATPHHFRIKEVRVLKGKNLLLEEHYVPSGLAKNGESISKVISRLSSVYFEDSLEPAMQAWYIFISLEKLEMEEIS